MISYKTIRQHNLQFAPHRNRPEKNKHTHYCEVINLSETFLLYIKLFDNNSLAYAS